MEDEQNKNSDVDANKLEHQMHDQDNVDVDHPTLPRAPKRISPKQRWDLFVQEHPKAPMIILYVLLTLVVALLVLYYFLFYRPAMEYYADEFCDCAAQQYPKEYTKTFDEFEYITEMKPCFADKFAEYSKNMTVPEKKAYLLEFQENVLKKCPNQLDNVFKYE